MDGPSATDEQVSIDFLATTGTTSMNVRDYSRPADTLYFGPSSGVTHPLFNSFATITPHTAPMLYPEFIPTQDDNILIPMPPTPSTRDSLPFPGQEASASVDPMTSSYGIDLANPLAQYADISNLNVVSALVPAVPAILSAPSNSASAPKLSIAIPSSASYPSFYSLTDGFIAPEVMNFRMHGARMNSHADRNQLWDHGNVRAIVEGEKGANNNLPPQAAPFALDHISAMPVSTTANTSSLAPDGFCNFDIRPQGHHRSIDLFTDPRLASLRRLSTPTYSNVPVSSFQRHAPPAISAPPFFPREYEAIINPHGQLRTGDRLDPFTLFPANERPTSEDLLIAALRARGLPIKTRLLVDFPNSTSANRVVCVVCSINGDIREISGTAANKSAHRGSKLHTYGWECVLWLEPGSLQCPGRRRTARIAQPLEEYNKADSEDQEDREEGPASAEEALDAHEPGPEPDPAETNEPPTMPPRDTPDEFTKENRGQICQDPNDSDEAASPSVALWHRNKGKARATSADPSSLFPPPSVGQHDAGKPDSFMQNPCSITFPVSQPNFSTNTVTLSSLCNDNGTTANFEEHFCQQQASYASSAQILTTRAVPTACQSSSGSCSSRNLPSLSLNSGPTHTGSAMGVGPFVGMSATRQTQPEHFPSILNVFDRDTSHQYQTRNASHPSPYMPVSISPDFSGHQFAHGVTSRLKHAMLRAHFQSQARERATDCQTDSTASRDFTHQSNTTRNRAIRRVRSHEGRYHFYRADTPTDDQYSGLSVPQRQAEDASIEQELPDLNQGLQGISVSPSHAPLNLFADPNGTISPPWQRSVMHSHRSDHQPQMS